MVGAGRADGVPAGEACALVDVLGTKRAASQPVFDSDSDEELGAAGSRAAKATKATKATKEAKAAKAGTPRVVGASAGTVTSAVAKQEALGRDVRVIALNLAIAKVARDAEHPCTSRMRDTEPTPHATFDVDEGVAKDGTGYEAGHDEVEGMAIEAWELAEWLMADSDRAVVVASTRGGDAVATLAGMLVKVARRVDAKAARGLVGQCPMPR